MGRNGAAFSQTLVLFDIDGTLIRKAGPHHREALVSACLAVTGLATSTEQIPVQGMLDRVILERMLRDAGVSAVAIRRVMPDLVRRAQSIYVRNCPETLRSKVCPGVRGLLEALQRRGAAIGLVTGNLSRIGWKKMERAGLKRYFRFGAFAESALDRAALVREAIRHARRRGWVAKGGRVWYIGDHPNDIRAARANRVRSIAVATGLSSMEELSSHSPDLLLEDLRALKVETLLDS